MDVHGGGKIADFNPGEEGEVIDLFPGQGQGDTAAMTRAPRTAAQAITSRDPPGQQPAHGGIDDAAAQRQQQ